MRSLVEFAEPRLRPGATQVAHDRTVNPVIGWFADLRHLARLALTQWPERTYQFGVAGMRISPIPHDPHSNSLNQLRRLRVRRLKLLPEGGDAARVAVLPGPAGNDVVKRHQTTQVGRAACNGRSSCFTPS